MASAMSFVRSLFRMGATCPLATQGARTVAHSLKPSPVAGTTARSLNTRSIQTRPEATTFVGATGSIERYYLKDNPWKLSVYNNFQKHFRYCVICKENRFSDREWSQRLDAADLTPLICKSRSCWDALAVFPYSVPRRCYTIETLGDKMQIDTAQTMERFEYVDEVTTSFPLTQQIPVSHIDIVSLAAHFKHQITEIDKFYFAYAKKNDIIVGDRLFDTTDEFLVKLAIIRTRMMGIFNSIDSIRSKI